MGLLFGWLPMPSELDQESWLKFLDLFTPIFLVLLFVTFSVAVLGYRHSAGRKRIYRHTDVFSAYTPLRWLWTVLGGAFVTAVVCAFTYKGATDVYAGMLSTCCEFFVLMLLLAFALSYVMMAFGPVTPRKFKYRPARLIHGSGAKPGRGM